MGRFRRKQQSSSPSLSQRMESGGQKGAGGDGGNTPLAQIRREKAAAAEAEAQKVAQMRAEDPLLLDLDNDPPNTPPQRGHLPEEKAAVMRLQLQMADMIRKKVLAPNLELIAI